MGFSRQEYWSGLPFPSPGDLPNPGIKPASATLQADSLPSEPLGSHHPNGVLRYQWSVSLIKNGYVDKNLLANSGDTGSIPGLGRPHVPQSK